MRFGSLLHQLHQLHQLRQRLLQRLQLLLPRHMQMVAQSLSQWCIRSGRPDKSLRFALACQGDGDASLTQGVQKVGHSGVKVTLPGDLVTQ